MTKNIFLSLFGIVAFTFFFLYTTEKSNFHSPDLTQMQEISYTERGSTTVTKAQFADKLKKILKTEPFPANRAILVVHTDYFKNSLDPEAPGTQRKIPYSVWVDKAVISETFEDQSIDGFRIIPIRYPTSGTAPRGSVYKKDSVNFLIMFTHRSNTDDGHVGDLNLMYDYNNPCPNPRNCP